MQYILFSVIPVARLIMSLYFQHGYFFEVSDEHILCVDHQLDY